MKKPAHKVQSLFESLQCKRRRGKKVMYDTPEESTLLYMLLIYAIPVAQDLYNKLDFLHMEGTLTCREIAKLLVLAFKDKVKHSLIRGKGSLKPSFENVDFTNLMTYADGVITGNASEDFKFYQYAGETIEFTVGKKKIQFRRIAVFHIIYELERRLKIASAYKQTFTTIPNGNIQTKGEIIFAPWKEMRTKISAIKNSSIQFNLSNWEIAWDGGSISPEVRITAGENYNIGQNTNIVFDLKASQLRYVYDACNFEIIFDAARGTLYVCITNKKGRITCFRYYIDWCSSAPEVRLEPNLWIFEKHHKHNVKEHTVYTPKYIKKYIGKRRNQEIITGGIPDLNCATCHENVLRKIVYKAKTQSSRCTIEAPYSPMPSSKPNIISPQKGDKLIAQFITPTCNDGACPTLMHSNCGKPSLISLISTGLYPHAGVIEIYRRKGKIVTNPNSARWVKHFLCDQLFKLRPKDRNAVINTLLDKLSARRIANQTLGKVAALASKLKDDCFVVFRALTPTECYRLQGVPEADIKKLLASRQLSAKAHYQLAGNSIEVKTLTQLIKAVLRDNRHLLNHEAEQQKYVDMPLLSTNN